MKKLTDDELALAPDWLRAAIECLDEPIPVPNVPPYRPYFPREAAIIREAVKRGWVRAEEFPGLVDAKEKVT